MEAMIPTLLGWAVLLPLLSFFFLLVLGPWLGKAGAFAGWVATAAIVTAGLLSLISLKLWLEVHPVATAAHHGAAGHAEEHHSTEDAHGAGAQHAPEAAQHASEAAQHAPEAAQGVADGQASADHKAAAAAASPPAMSGNWYTLGTFGQLRLSIGYYVDALTLAMFCMVTLIASCIHVYSMGYMHEELHDVTDHEVTLKDGSHLHRAGRYHRFFQYLSLFCFSMLGLVVAGNVLMTFVFWELVGICSYFLIGFYIERRSASVAANKAFIVNRVGDFGMIIGLMALWGSLGTFSFGDHESRPGIFSQVRPGGDNRHQLVVPEGMVRVDARAELARLVGPAGDELSAQQTVEQRLADWRTAGAGVPTGGYGYWLLFLSGVGIFCGCVGKSAQFPLHVWLPDAMEGPTPVSALVHSATMVAAGVFLVARFYPVFTPDVLLVIAVVGAITLFMAATIAITATDIKRVLAYSTVSQLGYMMTALGLGGWLAGAMHLVTHAFFKSLLFMCSGSVIHAVHSNEMTEMGGLRRKMPWTATTMLIGCLAIAGAGIPFLIGFSGYYSKDAILEQALLFRNTNAGLGGIFFVVLAGGAALTSFYMFRLWYMTFAGPPRNQHRYDHAHESPPTIYLPLVLLALFALCVAWQPSEALLGILLAAASAVGITLAAGRGWQWMKVPLAFAVAIALVWWFYGGVALSDLLEQARPAGTLEMGGGRYVTMFWPDEHASHVPAVKVPATLVAFGTALAGFLLATVFYGWRWLDPDDARAQFQGIHRFLRHKWWFDELYDFLLVQPTHFVARRVSHFDRRWIDGLVDGSARLVRRIAFAWESVVDRGLVDGAANQLARLTHALGLSFRHVQTGNLRQYVLFIVVGLVAVFLAITFFWGYTFAS